MQTTVYFDGLGFSLDIDRVAFEVFGLKIYWYGIVIGLGFALALIYALKSCKRFGIKSDPMIDVVLGGAVGAVICARLYYVIFEWDSYRGDIMKILDIRSGGLAIYGGIIGAFLVGGLMCKWRKVNALDMFDLGALGFLIGQGFGRWGNFFNQEAYGVTTNLPWAMRSDKIWDELRMIPSYDLPIPMSEALGVHPTFLYESLWCFLGFALLHYISKKHRKFSGQIALMYGVWYGFERFFVEGLRTDSLYITGTSLRASQLLSLLLVVACSAMLIIFFKKAKKSPVAAAENGMSAEAAESAQSTDEAEQNNQQPAEPENKTE